MKKNWSKHWMYNTQAFSAILSIDRFLFIDSAMHFSVDSDADPTDKFWKIREVMDIFSANCQSSFNPGQLISIDESLVAWRGHHSCMRYNKSKAAK
jgi:hypothetical protein